jgi:hypothetical protein
MTISGIRRACTYETELHRHLSGRQFIHITPYPCFPLLDGTNQRMFHFMEVLRRMFVLGRIAAAYVTAFQAQSKMDPAIAQLHALFANMDVGGFELYGIEMTALFRHNSSLLTLQGFAVPLG